MISFDDITKDKIKEHSPNWPQISDHSYRILTIAGCRCKKTNALLNQINPQPGIHKIHLYAKNRDKENTYC